VLKPVFIFFAVLLCLSSAPRSHAAESTRRVVIYDGAVTEVVAPPASLTAAGGDLWVTLGDLKRATRFVVKPQGVCRDELCFPIPKGRKEAFLNKQGKTTWFNLSEFARLVRQPAAFDAEQSAWYFGPRAEVQNAYIDSLDAPNFTLPDVNGKPHSLADFRGKKVLLITWASW
jgi:AhpC/TSA family